jgi:hypothetical protein
MQEAATTIYSKKTQPAEGSAWRKDNLRSTTDGQGDTRNIDKYAYNSARDPQTKGEKSMTFSKQSPVVKNNLNKSLQGD